MTTDTAIADETARASAKALQERVLTADPDTLALLLTEARSHYGWRDKAVSEETLRALYDIAKMGPTSMNQQPMRVRFVCTEAAKDRLEPCLAPGNQPKMRAAPVTAIVAFDVAFWTELPSVFPPNPDAQEMFKSNPTKAEISAFRNGTLQGAYLMLAARAVGLDVGAMSGFDNAKVDAEFLAGTTLRSNFLINMGYADTGKLFRRLPRLSFDETCEVI
ncbi:MAG: malonic semialdehyde reductase [Pseudomonadota bacterium]